TEVIPKGLKRFQNLALSRTTVGARKIRARSRAYGRQTPSRRAILGLILGLGRRNPLIRRGRFVLMFPRRLARSDPRSDPERRQGGKTSLCLASDL
ncbi:MAG: hypothetical protein ACE5H0_12870, partial [Bacteroidota bacterium]